MAECKFPWVDLRGRDLSGHNLECAELDEADLRGAQLSHANLMCAELAGVGHDAWDATTQRPARNLSRQEHSALPSPRKPPSLP